MSPTATVITPRNLPALVIPNPGSDLIALYPSSPLRVFPPPAPAIPRPLRERCGVSLTLHIDSPAIGYKPGKVPGPWSPKGHLQPHRNHLPRRRNPKTCFAKFHDKHAPAVIPDHPKAKTPSAKIGRSPAPDYAFDLPKAAEPQAIIPALWVAFAQERDRSYEDGFTHVVEICYASPTAAFDSGSSDRHWDGKVQRLRLALPESARNPCGRASLALNDLQLRVGRDFIAECLPKSVAALPEQTDVRVLVVVPQGRPTDAMCLLGCYLAFVAGSSAETILRCIDEEESILSVWKGEVSGEEMERIEKIATSWSWLSTIAQR
ncbi:hypothetical protein BN946_scf184813.g8 [Trametes cinnabarina]|uniref:Uncharacterized protein n=1 Tax=Pycnoporus cinnabarinus TaxID=5643 RepID=A0A060SW72_PYCCI|nr:hypothetical protein BN946_scf184813.g8 [Trametes cinnabarina]